jgi:hypothetical protein
LNVDVGLSTVAGDFSAIDRFLAQDWLVSNHFGARNEPTGLTVPIGQPGCR